VLAALAAWLAAAVWLVQLEHYDGLDSVLVARFFAGAWPFYTETRTPLLGALLLPAELAARALGLHPLDLRPHHAVMALLHGGYLWAAYAFVRRVHGRSPAALLAFVAALPTFLFFTYAPFISHDIFPGALLIAMLVAADRFARTLGARDLGILAALGGLAALVKPMFGVFWLCVMAAELARARAHDEPAWARARRLLLLGAGAVASLLILLIASSLVTGTVYPDVPLPLRGVHHLQFLMLQANQKVLPEPVWVYVRNLPAYGPLAVAALLPGVVLSVRAGGLQRSAAVALLVVLAFVHVLRFGSVRYLACVAPLLACVIVPVLERALRVRWGAAVALALLALGYSPLTPYDALSEASRIALPFYRVHPARELLAHALDARGDLPRPLYANWDVLSFVPERDTPLAGDLYHDIVHFGRHHLMAFYGLGLDDVRPFDARRGPDRWPDGAGMVLCTTGNLVNSPTWQRAPALRRDTLVQAVLRAEASELGATGDGGFALRGLGAVSLHELPLQGGTGVVLQGPGARALQRGVAFPRALLPGASSAQPVRLSSRGDALIEGASLPALERGDPPLRLRYFRELIARHADEPAR